MGQTATAQERLVSIREAAVILGCTPAAIRKWCIEKRLPSVKIGRLRKVRQSDLDAAMKNGL